MEHESDCDASRRRSGVVCCIAIASSDQQKKISVKCRIKNRTYKCPDESGMKQDDTTKFNSSNAAHSKKI